MTETLSAAANLALQVAKPEIFSDLGGFRLELPELTMGEKFRQSNSEANSQFLLTAVQGDSNQVKIGNLGRLDEIVKESGGDLFDTISYLVYPDQKDPRQNLAHIMRSAAGDSLVGLEAEEAVADGWLLAEDLLDYSLSEMKKEAEAAPGSEPEEPNKPENFPDDDIILFG